MQTQNVPTEELQKIVGEEHVRQAFDADAVDGVEPSLVVEPATIEETSEVMKLASREGLAVSPRGGGTKTGLGNPPRQVDLILSTARMDEIIEHVPGDQIVRAQAGLKLQDLQESLAESDQLLGIDPPEEGGTVGGIVAANASGPRRLRYGTVRDLIIGIKVVLADGTVAKAGGKVVKNVAGYDLSKLFTGSLGTLGVIAECNFRLHPRDEEAASLGPLNPPGTADDEVAIKISAPPAELTGVLDSTLGASSRRGVTPRATGQAGIGVTYVSLSGGDEEAKVQVVEELREVWIRRG